MQYADTHSLTLTHSLTVQAFSNALLACLLDSMIENLLCATAPDLTSYSTAGLGGIPPPGTQGVLSKTPSETQDTLLLPLASPCKTRHASKQNIDYKLIMLTITTWNCKFMRRVELPQCTYGCRFVSGWSDSRPDPRWLPSGPFLSYTTGRAGEVV